jgi:aspartyl-tRNA(Asn)/glutamyl-tRNA(Gln) amidotransferase subunit B
MPLEVIKKEEYTKISDAESLADIVDEVFASDRDAVQDALRNEKAVNFLLGKVMQSTRGRADPQLAIKLIKKKLATISA